MYTDDICMSHMYSQLDSIPSTPSVQKGNAPMLLINMLLVANSDMIYPGC